MMKQSRFKSLMANQSAIARKVYDVVPMQTAYTTNKVIQLMHDKTGSTPDKRTVQGVLRDLMEQGLIKEPAIGHWRRVEVHPPVAPVRTNKAAPLPTNKTEEPPAMDAMSQLAALADRALNLASELETLAGDLEDAAKLVRNQLGTHSEDLEKLQQLRSLLRDV